MNGREALRASVLDRSAHVSVVGQGYVGLTLATSSALAGFTTVGVDIDTDRVEALRAGRSVAGVPDALLRDALATGRFDIATEVPRGSQVSVICVPTPLRDGVPDLDMVVDAATGLATGLARGSLVILESTTYPGTTDDVVRPALERSGLRAGRDFELAYSPERIDPGNNEWPMRDIPRVVGGCSAEAADLAAVFYEQLVDKVLRVSSARAAELAKLLENTFRHVNIALVNEMAMVCHETGIDVWEVIHAAASKPFGFMEFRPGPGIGGHCIPLDPSYLAWHVRRDTGRRFRVLEQADEINRAMPRWTGSRIADAMSERGIAAKGALVLVLGVAYKPDIGDVRESPALEVIAELERRGMEVAFHDPFVPEIDVSGSRRGTIPLNSETVSSADCVAVLTPHAAFDLAWIAQHASLVFDATNASGERTDQRVVRL